MGRSPAPHAGRPGTPDRRRGRWRRPAPAVRAASPWRPRRGSISSRFPRPASGSRGGAACPDRCGAWRGLSPRRPRCPGRRWEDHPLQERGWGPSPGRKEPPATPRGPPARRGPHASCPHARTAPPRRRRCSRRGRFRGIGSILQGVTGPGQGRPDPQGGGEGVDLTRPGGEFDRPGGVVAGRTSGPPPVRPAGRASPRARPGPDESPPHQQPEPGWRWGFLRAEQVEECRVTG